MKVTWFPVGLAVVLLALPGCGTRVAPDTQVRYPGNVYAADRSADGAVEVVGDQSPTGDRADGSAGERATLGADPGGSTSPAPSPQSPIQIALSARCVRPGDVLVVTITGPSNAGLGMIIGYADHQPHGAMLTGQTDQQGSYVWRVVVEPTVPEGEAKVLVTATGPNWSREGGGTADEAFRVAGAAC